jgi:hypothetical protein
MVQIQRLPPAIPVTSVPVTGVVASVLPIVNSRGKVAIHTIVGVQRAVPPVPGESKRRLYMVCRRRAEVAAYTLGNKKLRDRHSSRVYIRYAKVSPNLR